MVLEEACTWCWVIEAPLFYLVQTSNHLTSGLLLVPVLPFISTESPYNFKILIMK